MSDQVVENARRLRDDVAREINAAEDRLVEWRSQLKRIDQFLTDYEAFAADSGLPSFMREDTQPALPPLARKAAGNSPKERVAAMARKLIEQKGEPIARPRLYSLLTEKGLTIEGTDPESVMNTMLWRTRKTAGVIHLRNVGFWLQEHDWPPSQYYPGILDQAVEPDPESEMREALRAEASSLRDILRHNEIAHFSPDEPRLTHDELERNRRRLAQIDEELKVGSIFD